MVYVQLLILATFFFDIQNILQYIGKEGSFLFDSIFFSRRIDFFGGIGYTVNKGFADGAGGFYESLTCSAVCDVLCLYNENHAIIAWFSLYNKDAKISLGA